MLFYILIFIRTLYVHYGRFSLLGYSTVSLRPWRKVSDRPYNSSFSSTSPTLPEPTYPHQNISKRSKKGVPAPAISHLWENIHQKEDIKRSLSLYGTVHFLPFQHASHTSQKTLLCFHCKKKKKKSKQALYSFGEAIFVPTYLFSAECICIILLSFLSRVYQKCFFFQNK